MKQSNYYMRHFVVCVLCRFGNHNCPTRSGDLTPLDFFLLGYLKSKVFVHKTTSTHALKEFVAASAKSRHIYAKWKIYTKVWACVRVEHTWEIVLIKKKKVIIIVVKQKRFRIYIFRIFLLIQLIICFPSITVGQLSLLFLASCFLFWYFMHIQNSKIRERYLSLCMCGILILI